VPVFGPAALDVSPRIGHIHVTVDDAPWHWADASGETLIVQYLPKGPHRILIELVDANHQALDRGSSTSRFCERWLSGILTQAASPLGSAPGDQGVDGIRALVAMALGGSTVYPSSFGPKETMDRLAAAGHGMAVLARIDHAAAAATQAGMELRPTARRARGCLRRPSYQARPRSGPDRSRPGLRPPCVRRPAVPRPGR
jgi:hypothetical protein